MRLSWSWLRWLGWNWAEFHHNDITVGWQQSTSLVPWNCFRTLRCSTETRRQTNQQSKRILLFVVCFVFHFPEHSENIKKCITREFFVCRCAVASRVGMPMYAERNIVLPILSVCLWCGLRPSVLGQDRSETKKSVLVLYAVVWSCRLWSWFWSYKSDVMLWNTVCYARCHYNL